jgi:hypothetical protein
MLQVKSLLLRCLAWGLLLGWTVEVQAGQFYNPRRYHNTRQSLTNRAVARRLARKSRQTASSSKTSPKHKTKARKRYHRRR